MHHTKALGTYWRHKPRKIRHMIHVKYKKKDNYPQDRELILFDRNAFQKINRNVLLEVNRKYNIFCPQVFVMECIAPNNTDKKSEEELEKAKTSLHEKLKLIENPIVLTGPIHISHIIGIPLDVYNPALLTSEQIAGNCIADLPITMKRIEPDELISYYEPRVPVFKSLVKDITERIDTAKGTLTPNKISIYVQEVLQPMLKMLDMDVSTQDIKSVLKGNKKTYVRQTLSYCAEKTLREIGHRTMEQEIEMFEEGLGLAGKYANVLRSETVKNKQLTVANYPHLAYPIYIYYLFNFITYARQINAEHLDGSYWCDFRYLHYLNFCDKFIANETSTPHIVRSLPYKSIRNMCIMTSDELTKSLI